MTELLEGWDPEAHPEVVEMIRHLAKALLADDDKLLADARPVAGVSPPDPVGRRRRAVTLRWRSVPGPG